MRTICAALVIVPARLEINEMSTPLLHRLKGMAALLGEPSATTCRDAVDEIVRLRAAIVGYVNAPKEHDDAAYIDLCEAVKGEPR